MNTSIVLTIIADDHPGIVQTVSSVLTKHGGSWTQSSMSTLAGQFAGILLASVPAKESAACLEELRGLESKGLHVIADVSGGTDVVKDVTQYELELVGNDRPGIIRDITSVLARHGINVKDLETVVEGATMGGGDLFRAWIRLEVSPGADLDALENELEDMADELMVDISLEM